MGFVYKFNESKMELKEIQNEEDIEFKLTFFDPELKKQLKKVKQYFDQNDITTDMLVYAHSDKHVQIIVRKDFYEDFILQLFKQHLLEEIKWG